MQLTQYAAHTVFSSHSMQLTQYAAHTVCSSHIMQLTQYAAHTVCSSHSMQLTQYAAHTVCSSHSMPLTQYAAHTRSSTTDGYLRKIRLLCTSNTGFRLYHWFMRDVMTGSPLKHSALPPTLTLQDSSFYLHNVFIYTFRTILTIKSNLFLNN
jgi:hypothetical protein